MQELLELIESYQDSHDDGDTEKLRKAFITWCSEFDMREAYVYGLLMTQKDQMKNHPYENPDEWAKEIIDILKH